jgi:hypothetical protein
METNKYAHLGVKNTFRSLERPYIVIGRKVTHLTPILASHMYMLVFRDTKR